MAILIEEEKDRSNLINLVGWAAIFIMVCVAAYYIFFVSPGAAIILPSADLTSITPISQAGLNAQNVVNTDQFRALKPYVSPTSTFGGVPVGRSNPFVSP
jgi:hypothetical protein